MLRKASAKLAILITVLSALPFLLSGGCQSIDEGKMVKIALVRDNTYSMAYLLLVREKFLAGHLPDGVTVQWATVTNHSDQRDALVSGQSDIGYFGIGVMITARENGAPVVPLSYLSMWDTGLFSASSKITTIDDITTHDKIANSSIGDNKHIALMLKLYELYGDAHKFDNSMIVMQYPELYASLQTGDDIAAAILSFPDTETAVSSMRVQQLVDLHDIADMYNLGNVVATTEIFARNNHAFVSAFHNALGDAIAYVREHPQDAFKFLSAYMEIEPELIQSRYNQYGFETRFSESGYDKLAAFMHEAGMIDHEPQKFADLPNYDTIPKID